MFNFFIRLEQAVINSGEKRKKKEGDAERFTEEGFSKVDTNANIYDYEKVPPNLQFVTLDCRVTAHSPQTLSDIFTRFVDESIAATENENSRHMGPSTTATVEVIEG